MQRRTRLPTRSAAIVLAVFLAALPADARAQASTDDRINAIIERDPFERAHWGIVALDAATGEVLYERDAGKLFVPASSLKLVVSAAAAQLLDPGFRYTTTLSAGGPIEQGTLRGDLSLRGTGDPTLSGRYQRSMTAVFEAWADSLAVRGVRRIDGGLVVDESAWDEQYVHGDWEGYDVLWWYGAPVAPFGFNDNAIDFRVAPGRPGRPAAISWEPQTAFFTFRNSTTTVPAGRPKTLDFDRVPGTDTIFAYGQIPADAEARTENFAVHDAARYAATVLREVLERKGVVVARREVDVVQQAVPATTLFTHRSPPLDSILGPILQRSQNWFAEQLLKTLAAERGGAGSWAAGLALERSFLIDVVGLSEREFSLRDASGLSAGNLMTPAALARLVAYIARTPRQRIVRDALPVSGAATGSLRNRLPELRGRVRAKTGSIRNVASLAGIVTAASGREVAFAVIANGTGLPAARTNQAIDDIVRVIAGTR